MELSTERRDLRHHLRTTSMDALRLAEDNEDNISNGIVYTPDLRKQILLAYTDDFGYILPANKAHIHLNFRERTAWTFGTHFRLVWCSITKLQIDLKFKNDWTYDQIDKKTFCPCKYFNTSHFESSMPAMRTAPYYPQNPCRKGICVWIPPFESNLY